MVSDRVVHIVDADRRALAHSAAVIGSAGYRVVTHTSGLEFLAAGPDDRPGCLVLDIHTPEPDGLDIQSRLKAAGVTLPVIVFTGENTLDIAIRAMRAGALHFLEKPYLDAELLTMVGEAFKRLGAAEDSARCKAQALERLAVLSPRETQVMDGMIKGSPNKIIAHDLGLSIRTVEMYRTNLMGKLNAPNLSAVFRLWLNSSYSRISSPTI